MSSKRTLPHDACGGIRPYQRAGVSFLVARTAALLSDEMGLGKTVQVISALRGPAEFRRALIVVPTALRVNWERELERWAPELTVRRIEGRPTERLILYHLPVDVLLASYDQIRTDALTLDSSEFDIVILDEAQRIKNRSSAVAFACKLLRRKAAWALTGTPVENRVDDLLSIFDFLAPGLLRRDEPVQTLRSKIKPYVLRRVKSDVARELPPIIRQELRLQLDGTQRAAYDSIWAMREATARIASSYLRLITRLKIVCNVDIASDSSVKWEALRSVLDAQTATTDKVLLFSQYVGTLRWLQQRIDNMTVRVYHGGMTERARDETLTWFREARGPCVLLISLKAGGVGLNLNDASTLILYDRWWNPAVEEQAINRAHRMGRTTPLHVLTFVVENTIEERIERILMRKAAIAEAITDTAVPEVDRLLSIQDLEEILSLRRYEEEEKV